MNHTEHMAEYERRDRELNPSNYIDVSTKQGVTDFVYAKGTILGITTSKFHVNDDLSIDAASWDICLPNRQGLYLEDENKKHYLKAKFSKVNSISLHYDFLSSVKNLPDTVLANCDLNGCRITSAIGGPKWVGGFCNYADNRLKSLEGLPEYVGGCLIISGNKSINHLTDIHKIVKSCKEIKLPGNIKRNILGLMLINDLSNAYIGGNEKIYAPGFVNALIIINKHLKNGKDILECQEELIANGLKDYAKI